MKDNADERCLELHDHKEHYQMSCLALVVCKATEQGDALSCRAVTGRASVVQPQLIAGSCDPQARSSSLHSAGLYWPELSPGRYYSRRLSGHGCCSHTSLDRGSLLLRHSLSNGSAHTLDARRKACYVDSDRYTRSFGIQRAMEERQCVCCPRHTEHRPEEGYCYGFHEYGRTIDNR